MRPGAAALALEHLDLVDRVVARMKQTLPPHVERDELLGEGRLALVIAADRFNGTGQFRTFALKRIYWGIYDAFRRDRPLPRSTRRITVLPLSDALHVPSPLPSTEEIAEMREQLHDDLPRRRSLTPLELKVVALAANGHTAVETAKHLHRSVETIKTHRKVAIRKLGAHSMVNAVFLYCERYGVEALKEAA